jgi:HK97 gp10 family phage protein
MSIEIVIEDHITEVIAKIQGSLKRRMEDACYTVQAKAIDIIKEPKHGRIYTTYFWTDAQGRLRVGRERWKPHQASAIGEPPAWDTGELAQNIAVEISGDGLEGKVGTEKDHGLFLEYGTSKMAPRPWLKPSFEQSEEAVKKIFEEEE